MSRLSLIIVVPILLFLSAAFAAEKTRKIPADAESVIQRVRKAAETEDLKTLRSLMVQDFVWSFGGDRDADQALNEWKKESDVLSHMIRVLDKGCRSTGPRTIECPGAGKLSYRAGFTQRTTGQWLMEYFVAGD